MKDIEKSKMIYESIEIPAELDQVVRNAIKIAESKRKEAVVGIVQRQGNREKRRGAKTAVRKVFYYSMTTAAAMFLALVVGLNSSRSFAMEMGKHPILGPLARVLTVRSYHGFDEERGIQQDIEVPQIEKGELGQAAGGAIGEANIDIQRIVDSHLVQAQADFEEYKRSFLESGGSEKEWDERTMDLDLSYEVKYQDEEKLSLVLYYSEASAAAYEKAYYFNINLKNNEKLSLEDLLGENYVAIANEQIIHQMEERMKADENIYYWGILQEEEEDVEGFTTVDENTGFYINQEGNPVVTFQEYSVAPGYMGIQEFEIISGIAD